MEKAKTIAIAVLALIVVILSMYVWNHYRNKRRRRMYIKQCEQMLDACSGDKMNFTGTSAVIVEIMKCITLYPEAQSYALLRDYLGLFIHYFNKNLVEGVLTTPADVQHFLQKNGFTQKVFRDGQADVNTDVYRISWEIWERNMRCISPEAQTCLMVMLRSSFTSKMSQHSLDELQLLRQALSVYGDIQSDLWAIQSLREDLEGFLKHYDNAINALLESKILTVEQLPQLEKLLPAMYTEASINELGRLRDKAHYQNLGIGVIV